MRRTRAPAVYILTNRRRGTLYIGVPSYLCSRVLQHREGKVAGFTKTYGINAVVWFESHDIMETAIKREKQLKEWRRTWKIELIERTDPDWLDLFAALCGPGSVPRTGDVT